MTRLTYEEQLKQLNIDLGKGILDAEQEIVVLGDNIAVGIELVKRREADVFVSAGNTGALMAVARFVLKMLPGVDRPAIISSLPTVTGHTHLLDLGAEGEGHVLG